MLVEEKKSAVPPPSFQIENERKTHGTAQNKKIRALNAYLEGYCSSTFVIYDLTDDYIQPEDIKRITSEEKVVFYRNITRFILQEHDGQNNETTSAAVYLGSLFQFSDWAGQLLRPRGNAERLFRG